VIAHKNVMPAYRIKSLLTAVILRGTSERFHCPTCGSILIPLSQPNAAGMIEARCEGNLVRVFERDLSEHSECIEIESDRLNLTLSGEV
jgi:hypothetical protein